MLISPETLLAVCEDLSINGNYAHANRVAIGAKSTGTIWRWIADAKKAKENNDRSTFYLTFRGKAGFWIDHIGVAIMEQRISMDGLARSQLVHGIVSYVRDPSTGYKLQARNYEHFHKTEEQLADEFLLPRDRYLFEEDGVTPVWELETTELPASLKSKILTSKAPGYQERLEIEQNIRQSAVVYTPAPWVPKAQRAEQVVDAEFAELPAPKTVEQLKEERKDILRRQVESHLSDPSRQTKPTLPVEYTGSGRPTWNEPKEMIGDQPADKPAHSAAHTPQAMAPQAPAEFPQAPTVPSYVRRANFGQPVQGRRPDGSAEPMTSSAQRSVRR